MSEFVPKKVYIAAPWAIRGDMEEIAQKLEAKGHTITHRWWEAENVPESDRDAPFMRKMAVLDGQGVIDADVMLLINSAKSEGKAVEQGIALSYGLPIIVVGRRGEISKNVFHYLLNYLWYDDLESAIEKVGNVVIKEVEEGEYGVA